MHCRLPYNAKPTAKAFVTHVVQLERATLLADIHGEVLPRRFDNVAVVSACDCCSLVLHAFTLNA